MTTIETARTLLAKESPELRRAVGELVEQAMNATEHRKADESHAGIGAGDSWELYVQFHEAARELIEYKGGKQ